MTVLSSYIRQPDTASRLRPLSSNEFKCEAAGGGKCESYAVEISVLTVILVSAADVYFHDHDKVLSGAAASLVLLPAVLLAFLCTCRSPPGNSTASSPYTHAEELCCKGRWCLCILPDKHHLAVWIMICSTPPASSKS